MPLIKWKNHNIEDVEVELLLSALKQRYGYDFTGYARASLKRRLLRLILYFDIKHLSELISVLLYNESVAQAVINDIVVPFSAFFRDGQVWQVVRTKVLLELDSFPWINIWQVGCGHGEETYTLAILLHEAGLLQKSRIFTSDINPDLLQNAHRGCWPRKHLEEWRENYRRSGGNRDFDSYFDMNEKEITIHQELKQSIEFIQHNLVEDEVFKEVQFVVCRNVLVYFGHELQEHALNLLTRSLDRGGYLLLGHSEEIFDLSNHHPELEKLDTAGSLYRKRITGGQYV